MKSFDWLEIHDLILRSQPQWEAKSSFIRFKLGYIIYDMQDICIYLSEAKSMRFGLKWWMTAQKASPSWNKFTLTILLTIFVINVHQCHQCCHHHHAHPPASGHVSDGDGWVVWGDPLAPDLQGSDSSSLHGHLGFPIFFTWHNLCDFAELLGFSWTWLNFCWVHCTSLGFRLRVCWTHP